MEASEAELPSEEQLLIVQAGLEPGLSPLIIIILLPSKMVWIYFSS